MQDFYHCVFSSKRVLVMNTALLLLLDILGSREIWPCLCCLLFCRVVVVNLALWCLLSCRIVVVNLLLCFLIFGCCSREFGLVFAVFYPAFGHVIVFSYLRGLWS